MQSCEKSLGDQLDKTTARFPNNDAIVYQQQRLKYSQLKERVNKLARGFLALGVQRGDKVALWLSNRPEFIYAQFAIAKVGATMVPLNTRYKSHEIEYILKHSDSGTLIMMDEFLGIDFIRLIEDVLPELRNSQPGQLNSAKLPLLKNVICLGGAKTNGMLRLEDMMETISREISEEDLGKRQLSVKKDDVVNLSYTAGTTGFPKGVMLTHYGILNHMNNNANILHINDKDRYIVYLPLFHVFGSIVNVVMAIMRGACVILQEYFDAGESLKLVEKERATVIMGVPTMYTLQLDHKDFGQFNLTSLRTGEIGASSIPVELVKNIINKMGVRELTSGYGMTEASSSISITEIGDPLDLIANTVGKAFPDTEMKIVNPKTGEALPPGREGEFLVRGYHIMKGYYKDPDATAKAIDKEGWFHTGDLGMKLENGYFKFVGRLKEIYITGGFNVYPAEVESFLFSHPKIKQAYVIGVPDRIMGDVGMAFVELKEGISCTKVEILEYCRGKIANFKIPKYIEFVNEFPVTASGKIQKFKLEEKAKLLIGKRD